MPSIYKILYPNERVIWRGKPEKNAFILPTYTYTIVGLLFLVFPLLMIIFGAPIHPVLIITILFAIALITVPPFLKNQKYPHIEYVLTNNRLILSTDRNKNNPWIMKLNEITEMVITRTGKLYPITSKYSIEPDYHPHRALAYTAVGRAYNFKKQEFDGELTIRVRNYPKLEGIKEPEKFIKILEKAIIDYKNQSANLALS